MSLDKSRVVTEAKKTLNETYGFDLDNKRIEFKDGKSATELIIDAIATAIINELTENGVIKVKLDIGLNTIFSGGVPVPLDGGASLQAQFVASTVSGIADKSTGTIE
tara:strand:- start:29 stop:349 length:321 start_codon:yes stop_codon:yes gene_type:complete